MEENKPLYHNMMEDIVLRHADETMAATGGCPCPLCKADVIACALNRLPPRYVRTEAGRMLVELTATYDNQFRADVLAALSEAAKLVRENPHH